MMPFIRTIVVAVFLLSGCMATPEISTRSAVVGYHVTDLDSGEVLESRNADRGFIPASTVKAITALAALEILGPAHRFRTTIHANGKLKDGVLGGNIWLHGGGDPMLSVQDLLALARQLRDKGVSSVTGGFFYDQSALVATPQIAAAQPQAAPYNPAVSALSLDFNRLHVRWRRTPAGRFESHLIPAIGTLAPQLAAAAAPPGQPFTVPAIDPGAETWMLHRQRLPAQSGTLALPVKYPARRTAQTFRVLAKGLGMSLPIPVAGLIAADALPVAALLSAPLLDTLRPALRHSNNLVSELIGRAVTRRLTGQALAQGQSAAAVSKWLSKRLRRTSWKGVNLANHSGLSAASRITPKQMHAVIAAALSGRYAGWDFASLLPVGGWDGALDGQFATPATSGRVWAKSGTMHYAKGLTGLLFTKAGKRLAFAVYITDFNRRKLYDADPVRLAPDTQATARGWIDQAESDMQKLIGSWVDEH
jgi:serine-type D-Ala-D-Ala carboxypeptidase/endopeptidase (penicillin-binding protein 4)